MPSKAKIAVSSVTFSNHPELVSELKRHFRNVKLNTKGRLTSEELVEFIGDADGVVVGLEKIDDGILKNLSNLKIVAKYGVGLDNIDLSASKRRNVVVGSTGGVNRLSVAEMTIGFMLALSRNLFKTSLEHKRGVWNKDGGRQLTGQTIGIIGVGHVGKEVIRLLRPFNCTILVNDIVEQKEYYQMVGAEEVSKEEIFKRSDFVTIHTPLTEKTRHLVNEKTLALMKKDAYLINTARGGIVDYTALKDSLRHGRITGAAVDVYDEEPPQDKELLTLDNLICTPHIGGNASEAVMAMGMSAIEHLKNHFNK